MPLAPRRPPRHRPCAASSSSGAAYSLRPRTPSAVLDPLRWRSLVVLSAACEISLRKTALRMESAGQVPENSTHPTPKSRIAVFIVVFKNNWNCDPVPSSLPRISGTFYLSPIPLIATCSRQHIAAPFVSCGFPDWTLTHPRLPRHSQEFLEL